MPQKELHKGAIGVIFSYARFLRKEQTKPEEIMWHYLRDRRLDGFKFRRQHPLQNYIADFYCHQRKLVVELDGNVHNARDQKEYDGGRTYELNKVGIKVIRFSNEEVIMKIEMVLSEILNHLIPNPSPQGEGGNSHKS